MSRSDVMTDKIDEELSLGELVKRRRWMAGTDDNPMTMDRLAGILGTHQTTVSNWENGKSRTIPPDRANALARVLPLTVEELVRAMGYELLPPQGMPRWLKAVDRMVLETADRDEQRAIRAVLRGLLEERQGRQP